MGDIIFVIKTLVVTVALVVMMQIKIGPQTIEQRALAWIHHSVAVEQLQEVAAGAVKAGRKGIAMVSNALGIQTRIAREEQTIMGLKVKRSEAYYKQKDREAEEAREKEIERIGSEALSTNAERN
jgi:hypothetical protein